MLTGDGHRHGRAVGGGRLVWRLAERCVLPRAREPRLSVLIFHRVLSERDRLRPGEVVLHEFEALIRFLARNFQVQFLHDAVGDVVRRNDSGHRVAITFDDGYADNVENALPVLKNYGVPATFFIATESLDSGIMWNDRLLHAIRETRVPVLDLDELGLGRLGVAQPEDRAAAFRDLIRNLKYREFQERNELVSAIEEIAGSPPPPRLMMTRSQVEELAREPLAEIGGHTVSHPILMRLPDREAEREIIQGKSILEELIDRRIRCFAYPNGVPGRDYSAGNVAMVRAAGFELAVSTSVGGFGPLGDVFQVPRIAPWDRRPLSFGMRMLAASRADGHHADGAHESDQR